MNALDWQPAVAIMNVHLPLPSQPAVACDNDQHNYAVDEVLPTFSFSRQRQISVLLSTAK
jgi:hypothetical protein